MSDTIRGVLPAQQRELPDPSLREVVFDVDDLGVSYNGKPALKDVNLEIYRNFVTAFIGPSGCGKSTFIRCFNHMNALIPGATIHGTIHYHGADLYGHEVDPVEVRKRDAYEEYYEAAKTALRPGATAHDVHRAVSKGFADRGYALGHVTGHSIGMTMIEFPKIGEGVETELAENMVFSMHPHAISADGGECLYMQDTWLVTADGGVPLADLPMRIFSGSDQRTAQPSP
jgi:energy-coupling factor transporter ATP-binding protein EcfA2